MAKLRIKFLLVNGNYKLRFVKLNLIINNHIYLEIDIQYQEIYVTLLF